jgi:hypothetical protein
VVRIYVALDAEQLQQLAEGVRVTGPAFRAETEDEEDEHAALEEAASYGSVVAAADVEGSDDALTLDDVAAFHVDVDGSGDLAWYATQEIDVVLQLVS